MPDARPMTVKVVLVTGGTGGIGKATATGLAALGARVGITGRDLECAEQAAAEIRASSGNLAIDAFAADLSSQAEVRRLAVAVLDAYPRLDVLVNNVGGFWAHRDPTDVGLGHTFPLPPPPPRSCSPTCSWIGSRPAHPHGSSPSPPASRRRAGSISTICRALATTPDSAPTASPSSPPSCSPTSWPAAS